MKTIGVIVIIFGLLMLTLGILEYFNVIKPRTVTVRAGGDTPDVDIISKILDFLAKFQDKAPWLAIFGILLVLVGTVIIMKA